MGKGRWKKGLRVSKCRAWSGGVALLGLGVSAATLLLTVSASAAPAAGSATRLVTEFPASIDSPQAITKGPDGNLWFEGSSSLGRVSPTGTINLITGVPNVAAQGPDEIASGPDGDIWFTTFKTGTGEGIGKINPTTLEYNEYSVDGGGLVRGIVPGPDGRLWFADDNELGPHIGAVTTSGSVSLYPTGFGLSDSPIGVAVGSDGNIWFVTRSTFGKVTTGGVVTVYSAHLSGNPSAITAGPDGNLWITELDDVVAKVTTGATVTEYAVGPAGTDSGPVAIAAGPDGNLWFTNGDPLQGDSTDATDRVGKITTSGEVTDYLTAAGISVASQPAGITAGPDGNIWFTEEAGRIARLDLHAATATTTPTTTTTAPTSSTPKHLASIVVQVIGKGSVVGSGISCPGTCTTTVPGSAKATVVLHANAAPGYRLAAWTGACPKAALLLVGFMTAQQYRTCTLSKIEYVDQVWDWNNPYNGGGAKTGATLVLRISARFVKSP